MLQHFLTQFDPRDLVLASLAVGFWLGSKRARESLASHGKRLGMLGSRVNRIESHMNLPPPALRSGDAEGNGE